MADRAVGIPVVKEGVPFIAAFGGAATLAGALGWIVPAISLGSLTIFSGWFFRNPHRISPCAEGAVVAPGDGKIIAIEEDYEPRFLKEQATRISIFLNIFDVHVNRIPCDGTVVDILYQPGRFVAANRPSATLSNEQNALMIRGVNGAKVSVCSSGGIDRSSHRVLGSPRRESCARRTIWPDPVRVSGGPISSKGQFITCQRLAIGSRRPRSARYCCRSGRLYARNAHETHEGVYEK